MLTQRNFFAELYKFSMRCLYPCIVPVRYVALYALQSGSYIPSPEWVRRQAKICHDEGEALWSALFMPKTVTIDSTDALFFERNVATPNRKRYFVAGPLSSVSDQNNTVTPERISEKATMPRERPVGFET